MDIVKRNPVNTTHEIKAKSGIDGNMSAINSVYILNTH